MIITKASPNLATDLSDLTFRAKAHWNYSAEQLASWRDDLTISPEYFQTHNVFVAHIDSQLVAYYAYSEISATMVLLDNIFVEPVYIGKGIGKALMKDLTSRINSKEINTIRLYSEPHAELFYAKLGYIVVGQKPTSVEGRFLPIMELTLK